jgi:hypothetical protein
VEDLERSGGLPAAAVALEGSDAHPVLLRQNAAALLERGARLININSNTVMTVVGRGSYLIHIRRSDVPSDEAPSLAGCEEVRSR